MYAISMVVWLFSIMHLLPVYRERMQRLVRKSIQVRPKQQNALFLDGRWRRFDRSTHMSMAANVAQTNRIGSANRRWSRRDRPKTDR